MKTIQELVNELDEIKPQAIVSNDDTQQIYYGDKEVNSEFMLNEFGKTISISITQDLSSILVVDLSENKMTYYIQDDETPERLPEEILKHLYLSNLDDKTGNFSIFPEEIQMILNATRKFPDQLDTDYPNWKEINVFQTAIREFVYQQLEEAYIKDQEAKSHTNSEGKCACCDEGNDACPSCGTTEGE